LEKYTKKGTMIKVILCHSQEVALLHISVFFKKEVKKVFF